MTMAMCETVQTDHVRRTGRFSERLTILITTYNRPARLQRVLAYAAAVQLPYRIEVLDSSQDPLSVSGYSPGVALERIRHVTFPPMTPPMEKIRQGLQRVSTPYVVLWADDDFLVPGALADGIGFLEAHPDYSCVHGEGRLFHTEQVGRRLVPSCLPYWQCAASEETASGRVCTYLAHATPLNYSIQRTGLFRTVVERCCVNGFGYVWGELALGSLSAIQGKVHCLNRLYLVKEMHAGSDSWNDRGREKINMFEWVTDPSFSGKYETFRARLMEAVAQQDQISVDRARAVVDEAFWFYLAKVLALKWQGRYGQTPDGFRQRVRAAMRRVPALHRVWRAARALPVAWQPASRHRDELVSIYQVLLSHGSGGYPS